MHGSIIDFIRTIPKERIKSKTVIEIGSQDINGTPRTTIEEHNPLIYLGVDIAPGKGVDQVINAENILEVFPPNTFDLVISTEMLEHVENWEKVIWQMKALTKIGGLLVITTRSPGFPKHDYPDDYWRFTVKDFELIFSDMKIITLKEDPLTPGVLLIAEKTGEINPANYPENIEIQKIE